MLRIKSQTGTPGGPDVIPLSDIEAVWANEGVPFIKVSGFMDHTPLAPYRYKPRPQGTVPSATPERPRLSAEAEHMLRNIGKLYAQNGFPNNKTWWFQFRCGHAHVRTAGTRACQDDGHATEGWLVPVEPDRCRSELGHVASQPRRGLTHALFVLPSPVAVPKVV